MERKAIKKSLGKRRCMTNIELTSPAICPADTLSTGIINDEKTRADSPERKRVTCAEAEVAGLSTPIKTTASPVTEAVSPFVPPFTSPGIYVPQVTWDYSWGCPGIDMHLPKGRNRLQSPDWKLQRHSTPPSPLIMAFAKTSFPQSQYKSPSPSNQNKEALKYFKRVYGEILDQKKRMSARNRATEDRGVSSNEEKVADSSLENDHSRVDLKSLFDESSNEAMLACSQAVEQGLGSISLDSHARSARSSPPARLNSKHGLSPEVNSCGIKKLCLNKNSKPRPQRSVSNFQCKLKFHENLKDSMPNNVDRITIEISPIAKAVNTSHQQCSKVEVENNNRLCDNLNVGPERNADTSKENKQSSVELDVAALLDDDDEFLSLIDTTELAHSGGLPIHMASLNYLVSEPDPRRDSSKPLSESDVVAKPRNGITLHTNQTTKCAAPPMQRNTQPNKHSTHLFVRREPERCTPFEIERKRIEAMKKLEERKKRLASH